MSKTVCWWVLVESEDHMEPDELYKVHTPERLDELIKSLPAGTHLRIKEITVDCEE